MFIRFLFLLTPLFLLMAQPGATAQPARHTIPFHQLAQRIDSIQKANRIPGLQVLVFTKDSLLYERNAGVRNLKTHAPVTDQTLFSVASITKSLVSASALMLVQKGQLALGDELKKLAPEITFHNPWESADPVRVEHLLEHTAGFDDWSFKAYAFNDPDISLEKGLTIATESRQSRWRPGTFMSYSNAGPPIVARIIEKKTGQEFESFVRQYLFEPLGMRRATFHRDRAALTDLATGYEGEDRQEAPYWYLLLRPTGGLNVSARELMPFVQMLMGQGSYRGQQLLQPAWIDRMETPTTTLAARAGSQQGYGLGNFTTSYQGHLLHGHDGANLGVRAHYLYHSELDRGIILLTNTDGPGFSQLKDAVLSAVMQNVPPRLPPVYSLSKAQKEQWIGYYRPSQFRTAKTGWFLGLTGPIHINEEAGNLVLHDGLFSEPLTLRPTSPNQALRMDPRGYTPAITLVRNEVGDRVMARSFGAGLTSNTITQTSALGAWLPFILGVLALVLVVLCLLMGMGWFVRFLWLKRKGRRLSAMPVRMSLFVYALSYLVMVLFLNSGSEIGVFSFQSITVFVASLLGPIAALGTFFALVRSYKQISARADRLFMGIAVSMALLVVSYMASWGMVGARFWL